MSGEELAEVEYLKARLLALNAPQKCTKIMWGYLCGIYRLCGYKHALATVKGWGTAG